MYASLASYCFGNVDNLRNAVANVFDELNRSSLRSGASNGRR